ncbi:MAG: D-hexose-6-phosphate mutarotase [Ornithinimicrobium sp.]
MAIFTQRTIGTERSHVTAYDHGAHVAQWTIGSVPVIWVSRLARYAADQSIRGGIPVCWPWFANGPDGQRTPSHGLVRTVGWTLQEQESDRLLWTLSSADLPQHSRLLFDQGFESTMEATVRADALVVSHTVTNTSPTAFTYELALHTYLHVGDVRDARLHGVDGVDYYDKVTGTQATQEGPLRISGEVDRIYRTPGPVRVQDPTLQRVITLEASGARNVVVWNPGPDGAAKMSDFADQEWTQMLCVETANIDDNAVALEPGQSHSTSVRVSVGS